MCCRYTNEYLAISIRASADARGEKILDVSVWALKPTRFTTFETE